MKTFESLRTMLANIGDVIVIIDQDGINRYKSPNIEKLFGWTPEELIGISVWENIHPDDLAKAQRLFKELKADPDAVRTLECRGKHKDGTYRWIKFTGSNLLHDTDIQGIVGSYHDITARKEVERSLRESEERFKALHNASSGGIAIHDKGIILDCNQGLSEISGYSLTELVGMDGLLLIAKESRDKVMSKIVSGCEAPYEAVGLRKNGEKYPVSLEARNVPYKGKRVRTVEFRDITERKTAEEEQEKLWSQLIHAQKMESVGRLAGGIAHDFNNMLSIILGNTEILMDELGKDFPMFNNLNEIYRATERSASLTRQLLTFARRQAIVPRTCDLNDAIDRMLKMLRRMIGENIELVWHPGVDLHSIKMDPSQIDQILANLCVNSRDSIESVGEIIIKTGNISVDDEYCRDKKDVRPGDYVMIEVNDNGCGIDEKTLDNIFEPFFTTKEVGKGTGLGLSTVYGIVTQNKGGIEVQSQPGNGTMFRVYLPQHTGKSSSVDSWESKCTVQGGCETILLVEDEKPLLLLTTMMLERLGYKVFPTFSPLEALSMSKVYTGKIDLLITDVVMPEMNGRELSDEVLAQHSHLKCLYMSGYTADVIAQHGVLEEGIHFINKPFEKSKFAAKVREVLDMPDTLEEPDVLVS